MGFCTVFFAIAFPEGVVPPVFDDVLFDCGFLGLGALPRRSSRMENESPMMASGSSSLSSASSSTGSSAELTSLSSSPLPGD